MTAILLLLLAAAPRTSLDTARQLIDAGQPAEAIEMLRQVKASSPAKDYLAGVAYFQLGRHHEASGALGRALSEAGARDPMRRDGAWMLGQSLYVQGRFPEAIRWLEEARRSQPANPEINFMLGTAHLLAGQTEDAVGAFARLYGVEEKSAAAYLLAGQMAVRHELNAKARVLLGKALALDGNIPEAHYLLGIVSIFLGEVDDGIAELQQEIAVNPNFAMAYYRLGGAYTRQSQWDLAIPVLQKAVWLNPAYSGPYILLGKAYLQRGESGNAEAMIRKGLEMDPNNYLAHYLLGQILLRTGHREEGQKELELSRKLRQQQVEPPPLHR